MRAPADGGVTTGDQEPHPTLQKPYLVNGTESQLIYMELRGIGGLPELRNHRRRRASSHDRTGGNRDFIVVPAGETAVLAGMEGAGQVNHIWITIMSARGSSSSGYIETGRRSPALKPPLGTFSVSATAFTATTSRPRCR